MGIQYRAEGIRFKGLGDGALQASGVGSRGSGVAFRAKMYKVQRFMQNKGSKWAQM